MNSSNSPLISIIVPVYNGEKFIETCLESLVKQNCDNYEVVIINDGSTDSTPKICQKFLSNKIRMVSKENGGLSSARNAGVENAKGQYVTFADADDYVPFYFVKNACEIAKNTDADYIIGGAVRFSQERPEVTETEHSFTVYEKEDIKKLFPALLSAKEFIRFPNKAYISRGTWGRIIKRDIALEYKFDQSMIVKEDALWNTRVYKKCNKIVITDDIWYLYYVNVDSSVHKYDPRTLKSMEIFAQKVVDEIDLSNDKIYKAHVDGLYEGILRFGVRSYIYNEKCELSKKERNEIEKSFYEGELWKDLISKRYYKLSPARDRFRIILYRKKKWFAFLKLIKRI